MVDPAALDIESRPGARCTVAEALADADSRALFCMDCAGQGQECGVLIARDAATGAQPWTLVVYANRIDPKMEEDAQLIYFTSMAFNPDGRLRIANEAGKSFLVDVTKRTVTPVS